MPRGPPGSWLVIVPPSPRQRPGRLAGDHTDTKTGDRETGADGDSSPRLMPFQPLGRSQRPGPVRHPSAGIGPGTIERPPVSPRGSCSFVRWNASTRKDSSAGRGRRSTWTAGRAQIRWNRSVGVGRCSPSTNRVPPWSSCLAGSRLANGGSLSLLAAPMEGLSRPKAGLIYASFSLPFCTPGGVRHALEEDPSGHRSRGTPCRATVRESRRMSSRAGERRSVRAGPA